MPRSGLLAMFAARAGAQHVFAIEGDPSLERAARSDHLQSFAFSSLSFEIYSSMVGIYSDVGDAI